MKNTKGVGSPEDNRARGPRGQESLLIALSVGDDLPPLRLLRVLGNLHGHDIPNFVAWLCGHGFMPACTTSAGSWLNTTESPQRILKGRASDGGASQDASANYRLVGAYSGRPVRDRQAKARARQVTHEVS